MRVCFISLGCPKNLVDSEIMMGHAAMRRWALVGDPEGADVIVVNTCSFIEDATTESIEAILEAAEIAKRTRARLIVTGCLPQRYKNELMDELPEVDAFLGSSDYGRIVEVIEAVVRGEKVAIVGRPDYLADHHSPRVISTPPHLAYLRIAEGCHRGCSFCIVPKLRGKLRSRSIESLVAEAEKLVADGVIEISIVAQDTTAYGLDIYRKPKLAELLEGLSKINGLRWIRLMYAYPSGVSSELLDLVASTENICNYIDLPIQHVSKAVLKSMGREQAELVEEQIRSIRTRYPEIALRTTLLVGFPGETEKDFDELVSFVREIRFERLGVFAYSAEEGTKAARFPGKVDREVSESRRDTIMEIQSEISLEMNESRVGSILPVLVDEISGTEAIGRTESDAYEVDCGVQVTGGGLAPGMIVPVRIERAEAYDLFGRVD
jgi:ribosomal protein S12 methylthiotransferase